MAYVIDKLSLESAFFPGNSGLFQSIIVFLLLFYFLIDICKGVGKFAQLIVKVLVKTNKHTFHPSVTSVTHTETEPFGVTSFAFHKGNDIVLFRIFEHFGKIIRMAVR